MQIVMIHGQNHRGSTYHIGKMVADALGGTVTEFFLPRDFGSFCVGCNNCFMKDESTNASEFVEKLHNSRHVPAGT